MGGQPPAGDQPDPSTPEGPGGGELTEEELAARMEELRQQLADAPAEVVVANHCFGLFELAALHLSSSPPQLAKAQLAIDAMAAVVEGLAGRLGDQEQQLKDGLAQLRMAYVQIKASSGG